jgi:hypothetical protein
MIRICESRFEMNDLRLRTVAVVLFVFSGASAYAYNFKISNVSWIGDALHVEVRTDAPEGTKLSIAVSDEKSGDRIISSDTATVTVISGKFVADGFSTNTDLEPLRSGHYWLSVAEVERPLAFVGVPITIPKRPTATAIGHKPPRHAEDNAAAASESPGPSVSDVKQSWVDDVLRITGKTDLPNGTWLNIAIQNDDGELVADEGFICAQVSGGRFVVEGFTKDGIKPLPPGRYKLSIEPQNPLQSGFGFSAEKTITVTKRPKFAKSRLAEVRAINVANYANAKDNVAATTELKEVSDFQRGESDMQLRHQAIKNTIDELTSSGALRFDCTEGRAWIDPGLWQASDAEDKENLARAIYETCSSPSIDIYDAQSAKKLARYGSVRGFRAY